MRLLRALFALVALFSSLPLTAAPPTPDAYLGYELGSRFSRHYQMVGYLEELARNSSLIKVERYGESIEGRALVRAVITSETNRKNLAAIRQKIGSIQDPRKLTRAEAQAIAKDTPAVALMAFGVHGDESSSMEAAMKLAWWLVTSDDAKPLLDQLVVVIDPLQNPDGHDNYVQFFSQATGKAPNSSIESFEHAPPWRPGRANHYHIDMNRDWVWGTQPESQARIRQYREWSPQLFVDFHEMGSRSADYFFPPVTDPVNANIGSDPRSWLDRFGHANAEAFSQRNWLFFVGETFDLFYPGYGDAWPSLRGAIGMTYEVAGGRTAGSLVRRDNGTLLSLHDRLERHFVAAVTTLKTAAANREALILHNYDTLAAGLQASPDAFLLQRNSPGTGFIVDMLLRQGIEVEQLSADTSIKARRIDNGNDESKTFPAGTIVVATTQPLGGLVRTLLERTAAIDKSFIEEQRKRVDADESDQFYDITAWSLPIASNVPAWEIAGGRKPATESYKPDTIPSIPPARLGWAISGNDPNVYHAVGLMLRRDIKFAVASTEITIGSASLPRGSVIVHKGISGNEFEAPFRAVVAETGVSAVPVDSFWTQGIALGSSRVQYVKDPKIALLAGSGVDAHSFGAIWFQLDMRDDIPHSVLPVESLGRVELSNYRVIVMPNGNYDLPAKTIERLKSWVKEGGTIVAIKDASEFLRDKDNELSKLENWKTEGDDKKDKAPERRNEYRVPGAAFRTAMNERSYLTFGIDTPPAVLIDGDFALKPLARKSGNVVQIAERDPLLSGFAWPESVDRLRNAPYLVVESSGSGKLVTFADEPNFRLFWRGTYPLLMNAILYSPSFGE